MPPLVSVIIPVYNRRRMLVDALRSVAEQTFRDYEVIVVDDGSSEDLSGAWNDLPLDVHYIKIEHSGVAAARNRGLDAAVGRYVAFLDSDDTWMPRHLEAAIATLERDDRFGLAYHPSLEVGPDGTPVRRGRLVEYPSGRVVGALFAYDFIPTSSVVCRRVLFDRAGRFDSAVVPSEDYDMWLRLSLLCQFAAIPEPLAVRRLHAGGISRVHRVRNEVVRALMKERFYLSLGGRDAIPPRLARPVLAKAFYRAGRRLVQAGFLRSGRKFLIHALRYRPAYPKALCLLATAWLWTIRRPAGDDPAQEVLGRMNWSLGGRG